MSEDKPGTDRGELDRWVGEVLEEGYTPEEIVQSVVRVRAGISSWKPKGFPGEFE